MLAKKIIKIVLAGIAVFALGYLWFSGQAVSKYGNRVESMLVGGHELRVETVSSKEKLEKGLSGRKDLCSSCGMLFEFQKTGRYAFWMKDMEFPLDLIWILQGKIVHLEKNIQSTFLGTLSPEKDADSVLEINAGLVDELEIKEGDEVSF